MGREAEKAGPFAGKFCHPEPSLYLYCQLKKAGHFRIPSPWIPHKPNQRKKWSKTPGLFRPIAWGARTFPTFRLTLKYESLGNSSRCNPIKPCFNQKKRGASPIDRTGIFHLEDSKPRQEGGRGRMSCLCPVVCGYDREKDSPTKQTQVWNPGFTWRRLVYESSVFAGQRGFRAAAS